MLAWLSENWINILVLLVVAIFIILAIVKIVKDRKAGIMACGQKCDHCHGGCASCSGCNYQNTKK
jgi:hypothetical protein